MQLRLRGLPSRGSAELATLSTGEVKSSGKENEIGFSFFILIPRCIQVPLEAVRVHFPCSASKELGSAQPGQLTQADQSHVASCSAVKAGRMEEEKKMYGVMAFIFPRNC